MRNKRLIDSCLFIPIHLRKFSKTFNIEETEKGYFPHFLTSSAAFEGKTPFHTISSRPNGQECGLVNIVSADCPHCISRKDDRLSKLQGSNCTARTLPIECHENSRECQEPDFAFLPAQFPPRCLFGVNSLKDTEEFNHFIQWHQQQ